MCEEEHCPICFDNFTEKNIIVTQCSHKFHFSCLMESMIRSPLCPLCRDPLQNIPYVRPSLTQLLHALNEINLRMNAMQFDHVIADINIVRNHLMQYVDDEADGDGDGGDVTDDEMPPLEYLFPIQIPIFPIVEDDEPENTNVMIIS